MGGEGWFIQYCGTEPQLTGVRVESLSFKFYLISVFDFLPKCMIGFTGLFTSKLSKPDPIKMIYVGIVVFNWVLELFRERDSLAFGLRILF